MVLDEVTTWEYQLLSEYLNRSDTSGEEVVNDKGLELRVDGVTELVVTWEKSDLRKWLNEDFYNTAFSEEEKKSIVTTVVSTPSTGDYTNSCPDTEDRVFVLSGKELSMDGTENQLMKRSKYTEYALGKVRDTYFDTFWVRSNMALEAEDDAPDVQVYDSYNLKLRDSDGADLCAIEDNVGVRPAIWVTMSTMQDCEVREGLY